MSEQAEDSTGAESADTRLSSFSSSLGPQRSAPGNPGRTEASVAGSVAGAVSAASSPADSRSVGDFDSAKTQLTDKLADARTKLATLSSERPEVVIAAAFVGGVVIATILKRLAR